MKETEKYGFIQGVYFRKKSRLLNKTKTFWGEPAASSTLS